VKLNCFITIFLNSPLYCGAVVQTFEDRLRMRRFHFTVKIPITFLRTVTRCIISPRWPMCTTRPSRRVIIEIRQRRVPQIARIDATWWSSSSRPSRQGAHRTHQLVSTNKTPLFTFIRRQLGLDSGKTQLISSFAYKLRTVRRPFA